MAENNNPPTTPDILSQSVLGYDDATEAADKYTEAVNENRQAVLQNANAQGTAQTAQEKTNAIVNESYKILQEKNKELFQTGKLFENLGTVMSSSNSIFGGVLSKFTDLYAKMGESNDRTQETNVLTKAASLSFTTLSLAVNGAGDAFSSYGDKTNSFAGSIDALIARARNSRDALEKLGKALGLNWDPGTNTQALSRLVLGAASAAKTFAQSADGAHNLGEAMRKMGARTGEWATMQNNAGTGLNNYNTLIKGQTELISQSAQATNNSETTTRKWYEQLGKLPGVLKANVTDIHGNKEAISSLAAIMQLAAGAGMDEQEVYENMSAAIRNYNLDTQQAIDFTARISAVSQKYGIELNDMEKYIRSTSAAFKFLGHDSKSAFDIMGSYAGHLRQVGLSAEASAEIVSGMTQHLSKLTDAQKMFISAQTGGPGGLRGIAKFDMEMRTEGGQQRMLENMIKTALKTVGPGPIVTTAEAAQSDAAAAQRHRQVLALTKFSGGMIKDVGQAKYLLDAMANKERGGPEKGVQPVEKTTQDIMKTGVDWQSKTYTSVHRIMRLMEATQSKASVEALDITQRGMTAGSGVDEVDSEDVRKNRENLQRTMSLAGARSAAPSRVLNAAAGSVVTDQSVIYNKQLVGDMVQSFHDIPAAVVSAIEGFKKSISSGSPKEAFSVAEHLIQSFAARKEEAQKNFTGDARNAEIRKIDEERSKTIDKLSAIVESNRNISKEDKSDFYKRIGAAPPVERAAPVRGAAEQMADRRVVFERSPAELTAFVNATKQAISGEGGKIVNLEESKTSATNAQRYKQQVETIQNSPLAPYMRDRGSIDKLIDSMLRSSTRDIVNDLRAVRPTVPHVTEVGAGSRVGRAAVTNTSGAEDVRRAATTNAARTTTAPAATTPARGETHTHAPVTREVKEPNDLNVRVEVYCAHCQEKIGEGTAGASRPTIKK